MMEQEEWVSVRGALRNPRWDNPGLAAVSKMQAGGVEERDAGKGMESVPKISEAPMATATAPSELMRVDTEGAGSRSKMAQGPDPSQHEVEEELAGWEKRQREMWAAVKMEKPKPLPRDGMLQCVGPCKSRLRPSCFSREQFGEGVHRMTCRKCEAEANYCYCVGCRGDHPRSRFSQTQLNKPRGQRRCIRCIDKAKEEREVQQAEKKARQSRLAALDELERARLRKGGGDLSDLPEGAGRQLLNVVGEEALLLSRKKVCALTPSLIQPHSNLFVRVLGS